MLQMLNCVYCFNNRRSAHPNEFCVSNVNMDTTFNFDTSSDPNSTDYVFGNIILILKSFPWSLKLSLLTSMVSLLWMVFSVKKELQFDGKLRVLQAFFLGLMVSTHRNKFYNLFFS